MQSSNDIANLTGRKDFENTDILPEDLDYWTDYAEEAPYP